ncbi:MAG: pentapeptide repeat-containing protein [Leptolyngbyaceae cyanobacterium]
MTDRGKYHGQRLKAKEVLRLYAAGERDFRGTILRGCNFRDADLSGADFTRADIRSARFIDANLQKVTVCQAHGGLQRRWLGGQFCLIILMAALAGFLQGYSSGLLGYYLRLGIEGETEFLIAAIAGILVIILTFWAIARQGFTLRALGSGAVAVAVAVAGAVAFAVAVAVAFAGAGIGAWDQLKSTPRTPRRKLLRLLALLAFPWFCWFPISVTFSTWALYDLLSDVSPLNFPVWQQTAIIALAIAGLCARLWWRGQWLDTRARNPFQGGALGKALGVDRQSQKPASIHG